MALLLASLAVVALAQEPDPVARLQDALLAEAADAASDGPIQEYEQLIRKQPHDDPVRSDALYHLALARYDRGELNLAREALLEGIRTGTCLDRCQILLGRIQLEEDSVRSIPVTWDFSSPEHGLFHPWQFDDKGSIRVQTPQEAANPALIWRTVVDVRRTDQLVVGFSHPTPTPREVSFRAQAETRDAAIRIRVVDTHGRGYGLPTGPIRVQSATPTAVRVSLSSMHPANPDDPPLDPALLDRLYLEDVSALNGAPPGPNALYLDDFTIE